MEKEMSLLEAVRRVDYAASEIRDILNLLHDETGLDLHPQVEVEKLPSGTQRYTVQLHATVGGKWYYPFREREEGIQA